MNAAKHMIKLKLKYHHVEEQMSVKGRKWRDFVFSPHPTFVFASINKRTLMEVQDIFSEGRFLTYTTNYNTTWEINWTIDCHVV